MDPSCLLVGVLVALWATLLIACPDRLIPNFKQKKKKFHGFHWGAYDGAPPDVAQEEDGGVEVHDPHRKGPHVVGSRTYAYGRGISFRS